MTLQKKVEIYKKLLAALSKGVKLAAVLKKDGSTADYREAVKKNEELAKQASRIRKNIHKTCSLQAGVVLAKIRKSGGQLQEQIRQIEKTIATAERVGKALGYVDDLIDVAKTVAKAMG